MRVRGFLNDNCLTADAPCYSISSNVYRPEATAQAKVIRHLSGEDLPIPTVQWEVAPDPDGTCAANTVTTPGSDNSTTDLSNTPVATKSQPAACRFRVDVLVDHGPGNPYTIIEVKRWRGSPGTEAAVDRQLADPKTGYIAKASQIGLTFVRDNTLNVQKWSRAYSGDTNADGTTNNYCVWADRAAAPAPVGHPGNVYFAPYASTPSEVRTGSDGGMGCSHPQTPYDRPRVTGG